MRIRFDLDPIGPLRVVSELPSARLAVLEGLNGIGKTLAIRILQVCTGEMPYSAGSTAWTSLCEGLGLFKLQIDGLKNGETIEWQADSRDWLENANAGEVPFKSIKINGEAATLGEVRERLRVYRIAGDETLIETLAKFADGAGDVFRKWIGTTVSSTDSPMSRLEQEAADLHRLLGEWSTERYLELSGQIAAAEAVVETLTMAVEKADLDLSALLDLSDLQRRREELRHQVPDLRQRLTQVESQILTTEAELKDAQEQIVSLAERTTKTQPVLKDLKNARRTLASNHERLSSALADAATLSSELGLEASREAHGVATEELQTLIIDLTERQLAMDAAPPMRELLDKVEDELARAEQSGLGEEVALDEPEVDLRLTVNQTRLGVFTRRQQLEGQPPPPEAKQVSAELAEAHERLNALNELSDQLDRVDRFTRLVSKNEERVDKALQAAEPEALAELQDLQKRRRRLDASVLQLAADRAVLAQQIGAMGTDSLQVVESRLKAARKKLGRTFDDLDEAIEEAKGAREARSMELRAVRQDLASQQQELARAAADVRRVIRKLTSSDKLAWLGASLVEPTEMLEDADVNAHLAAIDKARRLVDATQERLGTHRTRVAAIAAALRGVGRHLRREDAEATEYVPELESWFSLRFSRWFNSARVRSELLPHADGEIEVNVSEREVRWVEGGRERSRPLEAFSSGEQAYAYTRARLAVLDEDLRAVPNRLVVLDEFGAFIAHDRLSGLLSYLQVRSDQQPDDQVLVILPLGRDYASDASSSVGQQKHELLEFADQIKSQKYAVRVLSQ